jgi:hypothetical protein
MRALSLLSLLFGVLTACSPTGPAREKPAPASVASVASVASTTSAASATSTTTAPNFDPPAHPGSVGPALAEAGSDLLLTWVEPSGDFGSPLFQMRFARFRGDRWSAPVTVAQGKELFANWADFPGAISTGQEGEIVAHWLVKGADGYTAQLARSTDDGATWKPIGRLESDPRAGEHGFVSYAAEPGAAVRAFWLEGSEGGAMSLRSRRIASGILGPIELLDDRVCDCCQTTAAATPAGPVVVFRDRSEKEIRDVSALRRTASGWAKPVAVHADGWEISGCPVNGPAMAAVPAMPAMPAMPATSTMPRRLAVAWFTAAPPGPRVEVAFSEDGGATFGPAVVVDGGAGGAGGNRGAGGDHGDHGHPVGRVDVRLDPAGAAIVSWVAAPAGAGEHAAIYLRRIAADGKAGAAFEVPGTRSVRASGFPRMGRTGDRLLLAWVDDSGASHLHASLVPLAQVP